MSAPWPEELPRGFEFDQYKVIDCVWRGSVASVYRAESEGRGVVALKVFERPRTDKPADRRRIARGARIGANVRHPNLAVVLGIGVWQERPYVVTEWLDGCDLEDYLSRWGVMSEDEVAELGLHLISGLMALHTGGAAHGDIKPSSVFLCNGLEGDVIPKLLLSDLPHFNGLASPVDSTTRELSLATPAYLAPEAMRGRTGGSSADQYSVSAVLYECAVGHSPFVGETLLELLQSIARGTIAPLRSVRPELSSDLDAALLRALSSDPAARFETLRDFGRALWPLASDRAKGPWAAVFGSADAPTARRGVALPVKDVALPEKDVTPPEEVVEVGQADSAPRTPAPSSPSLVQPDRQPAVKKPALIVLLAASIAVLSIGVGALYFYTQKSHGARPAPAAPAGEASEPRY